MRRTSLLLIVLAGLLLGASAGSAPAAEAASCTRDGTSKRCLTIKPQRCVPGNPTVCESSRNACDIRDSGYFRCSYTARRASCRGDGGRFCTNTLSACTTTPGRSECVDERLLVCRKSGDLTRCETGTNTCRVSRGFFSCVDVANRQACSPAKGCIRVIKTCASRSGLRKASCAVERIVEKEPDPPPPPAPVAAAGEPSGPSNPPPGSTTTTTTTSTTTTTTSTTTTTTPPAEPGAQPGETTPAAG